jgi:hypothetical protein
MKINEKKLFLIDGNKDLRGLIWACYKRNGGLTFDILQSNTNDHVSQPIKNPVADNMHWQEIL